MDSGAAVRVSSPISTSPNSFIPVNTPLLTGREREYLLDCFDSGWISSGGPYVKRFEDAMAARLDRRYAVAVSNGTTALQVAVDALNLVPGDEVILPSFTIISCVLCVIRAGATPVVVDADPQTWNMSVAEIKTRITPRTRVIMAVHIYGLPVDMNPLLELAAHHGLFVIEDSAQGLGIQYDGRPCGSFGTISTLSFYPNKLVTTGEGGMVLTDDPELAIRCRSLRDLCFSSARRFVHEELGWNYRMTALQAAIGLAQTEQYDEHLARRRAAGNFYQRAFENCPDIQLPLPRFGEVENVYWVFGIVLKDSAPCDASEIIERLRKLGIETRPFFWPLHLQPILKELGHFSSEHLPVSEFLSRRGLYLPGGSGITESMMSHVVSAVHEVLR